MKLKIVAALVFLAAVSLAAACQKASPSGVEKVIKSAKSGDMTVALSSSTGELKSGENELTVTFTDASGKPVDVGDTSLSFHMAAMGSMAEMNDRATLTAHWHARQIPRAGQYWNGRRVGGPGQVSRRSRIRTGAYARASQVMGRREEV